MNQQCSGTLSPHLNSMHIKVVPTCQRDWVERLAYVMAAYRASRHEAIGFSPNLLVFGREVRARIVLVLETANDMSASSRKDFVERQEQLYREAYSMVRAHLGEQALRRKQSVDMRVRPATFPVGTWVWRYNTRRYVGRSPTWQRNYFGPFLVTKVLGLVDVVMQRTARSKPQVVHIDKLKPFLAEAPKSWLVDGTEPTPSEEEAGSESESDQDSNGDAPLQSPDPSGDE